MISKERKFIFIHIHKTGGTSIEKKLGHFDTLMRDVQDHRSLAEIEELTDRGFYFRKFLYSIKKGKPQLAQKNLSLYVSPKLTRKEYDSFYKFSFVRNTWGRLYSWYANVMRDELHRESYGITHPNYSMYDFLTEKIKPETFSQLHFLKNREGKIAMDFIGRFENLQEDFNTVCDRIGLEDSELPRLLISNNAHYTEFYDDKTKDLVRSLFKEEIDFFNFEYGG
ncbi:sulfotransferase family 2 domain-containing protein [Aureisphaera galaxeae]|uniref:sulfotransferase family 2 domain-containing protein n=1 Tax=Aureisphaera galaxeae TaxID=1538023 RepID=UPI00234FE255|nr:sulfotransferase family 2 domain-containing protein [Aureisphaera galaxeae]MDC8006285.1 sulfotransferase family 2 domain-containing protein [Aureisphaera galaxeae]